jgi:hypothetical protein
LVSRKPLSRRYGTGHVYEPAKIPATDQRISGLKVPNGFHIQKFAEIENPRMLTVGADGTIYVSQPEPGAVSMLKDTDMDGVADLQKVVAERLSKQSELNAESRTSSRFFLDFDSRYAKPGYPSDARSFARVLASTG